MGKQERNEANNLAQQNVATTNNNANALSGQIQQSNTGLQQNANTNQNNASTGFSNIQKTGGFDPTQLDAINKSFSGISSTGGQGTPLAQQSNTNFANAGAILNNAGNSLDQAKTSYNSLSDPIAGYKNFADTGGFSPTDKSTYIRNATSAAPALFNNLSQNLQQRTLGSGGYNPGASAALLALQRQAGNQIGTLNTQAQAGLTSQINQNKLAGLSGETSGISAQGSGLAGVGNAQTGLGTAQGNIAGTQGSLNNAITQLQLQGTQGLAGVQNSIAQNQLAGAQGQAGLYGTNQSALNSNLANQLGIFNGQNSANANAASTIGQLAGQPGVLSSILGPAATLGAAFIP